MTQQERRVRDDDQIHAVVSREAVIKPEWTLR
jgi:hypothetical protein